VKLILTAKTINALLTAHGYVFVRSVTAVVLAVTQPSAHAITRTRVNSFETAGYLLDFPPKVISKTVQKTANAFSIHEERELRYG
jgi:hypothetical protein